MASFDYCFEVNASAERVSRFHHSPDALLRLTPPPSVIRVHDSGPLADGMIADFTIWLGPVPIRWKALHKNVGKGGFTDVQLEGPMKHWEHRHEFVALSATRCQIREHIDLEHPSGLRGLLTRLLFGPLALRGLFFYRKVITRRALRARGVR